MARSAWSIGFVVLALSASSAWGAEDMRTAASSSNDPIPGTIQYDVSGAFEKLGRGLSNLFGGWLEVPATIHQRYTLQNTGGSFLTGATEGLFRGVIRTGVGAYETLTCWLPLPRHFAPILPTLDYFKREPLRPPLPLE